MSDSSRGRYEIKFVLNEEEFTQVLQWIHTRTTFRKRYPNRLVHSLYFDDDEFQSVKDNLAGIDRRKKTRLRWYSDAHTQHKKLLLEQKIRSGRLGYKDQIDLTLEPDELIQMQIGHISARLAGVSHDNPVACRMFGQNINPSLYIKYQRDYLEDSQGIRVTFDENIQFHQIIESNKLVNLRPLDYKNRILEIKFPPQRKEQVSNLIRSLHLMPKRHSKYLMGLAHFGQLVYL